MLILQCIYSIYDIYIIYIIYISTYICYIYIYIYIYYFVNINASRLIKNDAPSIIEIKSSLPTVRTRPEADHRHLLLSCCFFSMNVYENVHKFFLVNVKK